MSSTYNKGEWSEFYVFLHVLTTGKLHAADSNLQKVPHIYYNILAAIKNDIKYQRDIIDKKIVFDFEGNKIYITIKIFIDLEKIVIDRIQKSSGTFSIEETDDLLKDLKIETIKENS